MLVMLVTIIASFFSFVFFSLNILWWSWSVLSMMVIRSDYDDWLLFFNRFDVFFSVLPCVSRFDILSCVYVWLSILEELSRFWEELWPSLVVSSEISLPLPFNN